MGSWQRGGSSTHLHSTPATKMAKWPLHCGCPPKPQTGVFSLFRCGASPIHYESSLFNRKVKSWFPQASQAPIPVSQLVIRCPMWWYLSTITERPWTSYIFWKLSPTAFRFQLQSVFFQTVFASLFFWEYVFSSMLDIHSVLWRFAKWCFWPPLKWGVWPVAITSYRRNLAAHDPTLLLLLLLIFNPQHTWSDKILTTQDHLDDKHLFTKACYLGLVRVWGSLLIVGWGWRGQWCRMWKL